MASVEPQDLISTIHENKFDEYRILEQKKMLAQFSEDEIKSKYGSHFLDVSEYEDNTLKAGVYYSLLSALYAFQERELDPLEQQHVYLFKTIRQDIETVYKEISGSLVNQETWLFESF